MSSELGWIENRYATVTCTFARLLSADGLETELTTPKTRMSLVRFFDNSTKSRESNDDWNVLTEEFDRFKDYSNHFTIHQIDCHNPKHDSVRCIGLPLPAIQVTHNVGILSVNLVTRILLSNFVNRIASSNFVIKFRHSNCVIKFCQYICVIEFRQSNYVIKFRQSNYVIKFSLYNFVIEFR